MTKHPGAILFTIGLVVSLFMNVGVDPANAALKEPQIQTHDSSTLWEDFLFDDEYILFNDSYYDDEGATDTPTNGSLGTGSADSLVATVAPHAYSFLDSVWFSITSTLGASVAALFNFLPFPQTLTGAAIDATTANYCSDEKMSEMLEAATKEKNATTIDCVPTLKATDVITKRLVFSGSKSSNITFDCHGAKVEPISGISDGGPTFTITSKQISGNWSRPENITLQNCNVLGNVVIGGVDKDVVEISSRQDKDHTKIMQEYAPTNIMLKKMTIAPTNKKHTPVYIGTGSTYVSILNSKIGGKSSGVAIYLDKESAHNTITNNAITTDTADDKKIWIFKQSSGRELIAIDSSASNTISHNWFANLNEGGIFLYRNCGEDGIVRHQTPSNNIIVNNRFYYNNYSGGNPAIFVGSRNGNRNYCDDDDGYPFGSSLDDRDFAQFNVIAQNQIRKLSVEKMIRAVDLGTSKYFVNSPNFFYDNESTTDFDPTWQKTGCYISNGYPDRFLKDGESTELTIDSKTGTPQCNGKQYTCANGIIKTSSSSCTSITPTNITFECKATNDDNGCKTTAQCPAGKNITAIKVAADLEDGPVTDEQLNNTVWNRLRIVRPSDNIQEGYAGVCPIGIPCDFGGSKNNPIYLSLWNLLGTSGLDVSCKEKDKDGGDCHIRGILGCY